MEKQVFENEAYIVSEIDVLNYVTKTSTKEQREKFNIGNIYINAAVCKKCNSYIRSKNRHDYVTCKCGNVSVDGGSWYAKRVGYPDNLINISFCDFFYFQINFHYFLK